MCANSGTIKAEQDGDCRIDIEDSEYSVSEHQRQRRYTLAAFHLLQ